MLQRANPQTKAECELVLDKIRQMILDGKLKLQNTYNVIINNLDEIQGLV